jgi:hypothetical protein
VFLIWEEFDDAGKDYLLYFVSAIATLLYEDFRPLCTVPRSLLTIAIIQAALVLLTHQRTIFAVTEKIAYYA